MLSCMESAFPVQKEISLLYALFSYDTDQQYTVRQPGMTIWNGSICTCMV